MSDLFPGVPSLADPREFPRRASGDWNFTAAVMRDAPWCRILEAVNAFHQGDYGRVTMRRAASNEFALRGPNRRILAVYALDQLQPTDGRDNCLWIVTNQARTLNTVCMPWEV